MPSTDFTQPIVRREAIEIVFAINEAREIIQAANLRALGNGHGDAPILLDECLSNLCAAVDSINLELDGERDDYEAERRMHAFRSAGL